MTKHSTQLSTECCACRKSDNSVAGKPYNVFGYKGKQVRDNIHSNDLIQMFWHFYQSPRPGEVYNAGGGRFANCSVLEAIRLCEEVTGKKLKHVYSEVNRKGDHIWYISNTKKFQEHYPAWQRRYDLRETITEIVNELDSRL